MHWPSRLSILYLILYFLYCISFSSTTPFTISKASVGDLTVLPRVSGNGNSALSLNGEWRIIVIEMALLSPVRSAVVAVSVILDCLSHLSLP